ncbi:MAG: methyltransferase domain-containing protein [Euryarchaeota archaeon]|jgi:SAM-dependent methyltransferase|nr:methyltransferase domain-containing protein [Euryarchaeota archaeon]
MEFKDLQESENIYLYAGDLPEVNRENVPFIGLTLKPESEWWNEFHIKHDVTGAIDLPDNSVDIFQSEDVFEHIDYDQLKSAINEIYRVLKPGGLFRLSMPDYRCDLLHERSKKDKHGNIIFDRGGGGRYLRIKKKVVDGGHVWFPKYESTKSLLDSTEFTDINFLHYYDTDGTPILNKIDYSKCFVRRTPDFDERVSSPMRPMSIVVDCSK